MSWFRVDDRFHQHHKAHKAGNAALGLWVMLGSYAAEHRRGEIPVRIALTYGTRRQIDRLIDVGLLERNGGGGLAIHDWQQWQGPLSDADRARLYRLRKASRDVTKARDPDDRRPPDDLTTDDDDDVVQISADVTKRDAGSSSSSIDEVINLAANAIAAEKQNTTSGYVRGIAKNLRAERLDEITAALETNGDVVKAAGTIAGSHVAAREAARRLSAQSRAESCAQSRAESSTR